MGLTLGNKVRIGKIRHGALFNYTLNESFIGGVSRMTYGDTPIFHPTVRIKDPSVWIYNGKWYMYCSTSSSPTWATYDTCWFTSLDGINWDYQGIIFLHGGDTYYSRSIAATSKAILKDGTWHIWVDSQTDTEQTISHFTCSDIDNPIWIADTANNPCVAIAETPVHTLDPFIVLEAGLYYMFFTHTAGVEQIAFITSTDLVNWSAHTDVGVVKGEGPIVTKAPNGKWRIITTKALQSSLTSEDLDVWESNTLTSGYSSSGKLKISLSAWSGICWGHGDIVEFNGKFRLFYNSTWNGGENNMVVSMSESTDMYNFQPFNFSYYEWAKFWNVTEGIVSYQNLITNPPYVPFIRRYEFYDDFDLSCEIRLDDDVISNKSGGGIILFGKNTNYRNNYVFYLQPSLSACIVSRNNIDGVSLQIGYVAKTYIRDTWYTLRMKRTANLFEWWVDGVKQTNITNSDIGSVSLGLYANKTKLSFRNVLISGKQNRS